MRMQWRTKATVVMLTAQLVAGVVDGGRPVLAHAGDIGRNSQGSSLGGTVSVTYGSGGHSQVPEDFVPAPRLDDVRQEIGWTAAEVERLNAESADSANQQLLADLAAVSEEPIALEVLQDPVEPSDLVSYLVEGSVPSDYMIVTAEANLAVDSSGSVYQPGVLEGEMSGESRLLQLPPEFSGPWFDPSYNLRFYRITRGHDASWWDDYPLCNGRVEFKMGVWLHSVRLGPFMSTRPKQDFFGFWRTLAAERTRQTGGLQCEDYLMSLESRLRLWDPADFDLWESGDWVAKDPLSFPSSGDCETTNLSVSWEDVGISRSFEHCERWDTTGASAGDAFEYYGINYDFGGVCHARARSGHYLMIVRGTYNDTSTQRWLVPAVQWTHELEPDQAPVLIDPTCL